MDWDSLGRGIHSWSDSERQKADDMTNRRNGQRDSSGNPFDTAAAHKQYAAAGDVIGGLVDFLGGAPGKGSLYQADPNAYQINGYSTGQFDQAANQAAQRQNAGNTQNRDAQTALLQQLQMQAQDGRNSAAYRQFQNSAMQNNADNLRMAAASRGPQQGAQLKSAMQASAQGNLQNAGDMNMLKLQQQQAAQGMVGQLANQTRGQDLQFQGMNDDLVKFYTQSGLSLAQSQQQAAAALEKLRTDQQLELEKARLQGQAQSGNFLGNLFNTIGSM